MLTGDPPFDGDTVEILQKHRDQAPVPLREHRADVGVALEALVSQLLAKPPDSRPASAAEVKARLEAAQDGVATIATPTQASTSITTRMSAVSPVVSAPRRSAHRVSARAAVPPIPKRHVRRIVSGALAAVGTLVVVTTVAVFLAAASKPAGVQAEGGYTEGVPTMVTASALATASVTPTEEVTPTPVSQSSAAPTSSDESVAPVSSSQPPTDPIANLRLSIQQQVNTGNLNPLKASTLYTKVDGIAQSINASNFDDVRHKIQDFRNTLVSLLNGGQLTATGYDVLSGDLDAIPLA
jgi:serine/threonine-protein kinase